jgi:hypothetical protein
MGIFGVVTNGGIDYMPGAPQRVKQRWAQTLRETYLLV